MGFDITSYLLAKKDLETAMEEVPHLNESGKIPADALPSYVDDINEAYYYNGKMYEDEEHTIEVVGEEGKIYVDLYTNFTYRWSGNTYVRVNEVDLSDYYNRSQINDKFDTATENLNAEITRAKAAEKALGNRVTTIEEDYLTSNDAALLSGDIADERERASGEEGLLNTAITNEATRATTAEETIAGNLTNEITRATTAEQGIINDLSAEVTNRTNAVAAERNRAEAAESDLSDDIDAEVNSRLAEESRAKAAEKTISDNLANEITNRTAAVSAEETRATTAEDALQTALTQEIANRQADVDAEETRAKVAEKDLGDSITAEATARQAAVLAEQNRATAAEGTLDSRITSVSSALTNTIATKETEVKGLITAEATRASGAEQNLNTRITNEVNAHATDITSMGELLGFVKNVSTGVFSLTENGYVKTTKNLADNNKARLDNLAGGIEVVNKNASVKGDLTVKGDLVVEGTTTTTDQETIQSQSALIVTNASNAPLANFSGVVVLKGSYQEYEVTEDTYNAGIYYYKDENNHYVLDESNSYTPGRTYYVQRAEAAGIYDKTEDALLLGEGIYFGGNFYFDSAYILITLTQHSYVPGKYYIKVNDTYVLATGAFDPTKTYYAKVSQGQHLATRVDSQYLTDKHLIEWDGNSNIFIDSGKTIEDIETEIANARTSLNTAITAEETRAKNAESSINDSLNTEITNRATAVTAEANRAKGVEEGLDGRVAAIENDYLTSADKTELSNSINAVSAVANSAVQDSNYVHTDNNFTNTYKQNITTNNSKVSNVQADWKATTGLAVVLNKPETETWTFTLADGTVVTKKVYVG